MHPSTISKWFVKYVGLILIILSLKLTSFHSNPISSPSLTPVNTVKMIATLYLETRLLPYFGHFYINKIKPTDIMQFYDLLSRDTQLKEMINSGIAISLMELSVLGVFVKTPLSAKYWLERLILIILSLKLTFIWKNYIRAS